LGLSVKPVDAWGQQRQAALQQERALQLVLLALTPPLLVVALLALMVVALQLLVLVQVLMLVLVQVLVLVLVKVLLASHQRSSYLSVDQEHTPPPAPTRQ
jgi:hypothetical protein